MKLKFTTLIFTVVFSINILGNNIIKTSSGVSEGYLRNSVINWDDIPYAQPPVGDLRWKAPRALKSSQYIKQKKKKISVSKSLLVLGVQKVLVFFLALRTVYI